MDAVTRTHLAAHLNGLGIGLVVGLAVSGVTPWMTYVVGGVALVAVTAGYYLEKTAS